MADLFTKLAICKSKTGHISRAALTQWNREEENQKCQLGSLRRHKTRKMLELQEKSQKFMESTPIVYSTLQSTAHPI